MKHHKNSRLKIDPSEYRSDVEPKTVLYGLPKEVKFCKKCVISNQRPTSTIEFEHTEDSSKNTIHFDSFGICDACRLAEEKRKNIDWKEREAELWELCNRHKRNDGSYDCVVPGSGGKDSFYASHILKEKFGMNPLTVTWAPHIYTEGGWENFERWVLSCSDNYRVTPNTKIHRLITRMAVENLFHPFQPFMFGQKSIAPRIAALLDIPLVFYGENEAEYGNPIEDISSAKRESAYFASKPQSTVYLGGISVDQWRQEIGISNSDLSLYMPIPKDLVEEKTIQVHYLGYYLFWHPQGAYYYAVDHGDFHASPERTPGTYSKYNSIDDKMDDLHYFTTYIKFGLGRATYDAAQEIRNSEITRDEGILLVEKYDGEYPLRFETELFDYLSIRKEEYPEASKWFDQPIVDRDYFLSLADKFRSPHLWKLDHGTWALREKLGKKFG